MAHQLSLFPQEQLSTEDCLYKTCIACLCSKPTSDFSILVRRQGDRNTLRTVCKECTAVATDIVNSYRHHNPIPEDFACPLCKRSIEDFHSQGRYRTQSPFSVDHNPETLEIRGWICNPCNSSMGLAKHSVSVLENMIKYLQA